jgi:two-component system phosphate regulon sensor histidine kinase PhoR
MFRSRLFWRLFGGFCVVIALLVVLVEIFVPRQIERDTLAEIEHDLDVRTALVQELILPFLAEPAESGLQNRVQELADHAGVRLTIIRDDGLVLADSEEPPASMDDHGQRPEIQSARREGTGRAIRYSYTLGTRMMYFARSIQDNGDAVVYVRAAMPMSVIDDRIGQLHSVITIGALLAALAALVAGAFIAERNIRPMRALTNLARALTRGEATSPIPVRGRDEVGELAEAFDSMAVTLRERLASLTEERNRLQAILSGMVEGVVAVDEEERVLHMNGVAAQLLEIDREESLGRPLWEITRTPQIGEILRDCLQRRLTARREIRQTTPEGERILEIRCSALPGVEAPAGAILLLHEITELRRLEAVRRDFVANVSHELKTPLTAIRGLIETIRDDPDMTPEMRGRFLDRVSQQADRLTALIEDLLSLSRLESGETPLTHEQMDLRDVAQAVTTSMATQADAAGLILEAELPENPVHVLGDRLALEQAIGNLLDNALKYTPAGGRIWLRIRRETDHAIAEVEDTGIGIEPQDRERIFERFYRVDKARSREVGGTGLGLSIVKHVLRSHGGNVHVESVPGRGSLFRIHLPIAD